MPISQQKLLKLHVQELKNLKDVEIDFSQNALTAIMGANGCGKSTVLHALACSYGAPVNDVDYKFPEFFKPSTDALWAGSEFTLHYEQRDGANYQAGLSQRYAKAADRWAPRYDRRPERPVRLVTIRESVPEVELLGLNTMVHYHRGDLVGATHNLVREAAGQVLNRYYAEYQSVQYQRGGRRSIAVTSGNIRYAALSMSAGEQRVFKILDTVFSAPDYALILVDEIDVFLHQDALKKLIDILQRHCNERHKQLVFTTHFPPIADMYQTIAVKTLHRVPQRTLIWEGYSYDALRLITGQIERPLKVYVEDDIAEAVVREVARPLGLRPYIHVGWYGPCENAFALGAGLVLSGVELDNCLIVLDGDVSATPSQRRGKVNRYLTGNEQGRADQRRRLVQSIRPLRAAGGLAPERVLHQMVTTLNDHVVPQADRQFLRLAREIVNVPERHAYVDDVVRASGETREYAVNKLVELASLSPEWGRYTRLVRVWLERRKESLNLDG
ncbi:hypothetical protein CJO94_14690 [Ralstonia solanacearum]|nr:hypothetical protein CJO94_14690 [Ralstonia solanacearum]